MRILIVTVQVPFVQGGAEVLTQNLQQALQAEGHEAEVAAIPFKWYPPERIPEQMLACRLLDVTESAGSAVDRVIGLRFPAYLVSHPHKVMWIMHQHRTAYELWDSPLADLCHSPRGAEVRDAIRWADRKLIPEARAVFTISATVSKRLQRWSGVDSSPLYPPPADADQYYCEDAEDYLFFPSRLIQNKRQDLVLEALARTRHPVRLRFAGTPDHPPYAEELRLHALKLGVSNRVEWLGRLSEEEKHDQYARALGVVFPPQDEDLGYVTLEAMLSSKPVITCTDSGGPLEFAMPRESGLVVEPTPEALATALDELWDNRRQAQAWGKAGRARYDDLNLGWDRIVERLLA